jgi:uroporphyrinogen decarboxylase
MASQNDLVLKTFNFEETLRIPVGFWFHLIPEAETGDALEKPSLAEDSVKAHLAFIRDFKPDMVKLMSDGFFFYPVKGELEKPEDLRNIKEISPDHPWIEGQLKVAREIKNLYPHLPYFYNIFSPSTSLKFLIGREKHLKFLRKDPELTREALGEMGKGLSHLAKRMADEVKVTGIYLSVQNPKVDLFSTDFYGSSIGPSELLVLKASSDAGGLNILHICGYGGVKNRLSDYASYPAEAISFARTVEGVSFPEARRIFPSKVLIAGFPNTKGSVLHKGSKEEVEAYAASLLAEIEDKRGIIIGADCTVPSDIDLNRLNWARLALARP